MSHFNFENTVAELTRLDAPLQSRPPTGWRRRAASNVEPVVGLSPRRAKTPGKNQNSLDGANGSKTPGTSKTPGGKTPGKSQAEGQLPQQRGRWKTPSKTPSKKGLAFGQQDRYIPSRATTDIDLAHYCVMMDDKELSPSKSMYRQQLQEALSISQNPVDSKILSYQGNQPKPQEGYMNNLQVIYSGNMKKKSYPKNPNSRVIPNIPDRILDAPELLDDYYLNLLDWSSNNHVAVALGSAVYIWNASAGDIVQLMSIEEPEQYVSSVKWIKEGNILAVGTSTGNVQLWDVGEQKLIRTMAGHASRVGALSWNSYICSSGSRSGSIHHHDVRVAEHHVATLANHSQEVCGLAWSPDGRYLASGGNDNVLNIWPNHLSDDVPPLFNLTHHQAAVKALAWCPWQSNILASGGGTADRHIRLWNVNNGSPLAAINTDSQVSAILFNKEYKEVVSGHGFSQYQLSIWKYPDMVKVTDLTGHQARILCLSMSPDGTTVASAAADETIRIWNCFSVDKTRKPSVSKTVKESSNLGLATCIR